GVGRPAGLQGGGGGEPPAGHRPGPNRVRTGIQTQQSDHSTHNGLVKVLEDCGGTFGEQNHNNLNRSWKPEWTRTGSAKMDPVLCSDLGQSFCSPVEQPGVVKGAGLPAGWPPPGQVEQGAGLQGAAADWSFRLQLSAPKSVLHLPVLPVSLPVLVFLADFSILPNRK
uniref:Uncharacterized protein n=1 Tax=Poecilia mexicana TaxID=48701 RepID=A0A3B3Y1M2_9TELE